MGREGIREEGRAEEEYFIKCKVGNHKPKV